MKSPPTFDPDIVKSVEAKLAALVLPDTEGESGRAAETGDGSGQPVTTTTNDGEQKQQQSVTAVQ